jgi:hypothetical protein
MASCAVRGPSPWFRRREAGTLTGVSNPATHGQEDPHGASLLPRDLTEDEFAAAPVLESLDALLIEDLTDDEYDSFVAALS